MADPVSAGILITLAATTAAMQGISQYQSTKAQSGMAQRQADILHQQGEIAQSSATANEATSIRHSAGVLGEQAAALGEANIGTSGSAADVERQSAGMARLDALNIWYGGQLEKRGYELEAQTERYNALSLKNKATMDLIGAGINVGTKIVTGVAGYGGGTGGGPLANMPGTQGVLSAYGGGGGGYG